MAPTAKDNNDQKSLRRSCRSNFGKLNPSLHKGYVVGDVATRPAPRPKRRRPLKSVPVDDDDEEEPALASSTLTATGRAVKTKNKRRTRNLILAVDDNDELTSSSSPFAPRRESIVLDCIHVKLPPDMQIPSSPIAQTLQLHVDSPVQQQQGALFSPAPIQPLVPSILVPTHPAPSPPKQAQQAPNSDEDLWASRDADSEQAGQVDIGAMDMDIDFGMYLNLDPEDDEMVVEKLSPSSPSTKISDMDWDDGFANIMQWYGQNSDEKILQDRLAAQGRYSGQDGSPDELSAKATRPSAYSDVFETE